MTLLIARPLATLALIVSVSACATTLPHAALHEAPPSSAPYEVRAAYYKAHALDRYDGNKLQLHDGTPIYWPEDLKPAVAADSPTAKAIDRSVVARAEIDAFVPAERALLWTAAAGLGLVLLPLALPLAIVAFPQATGPIDGPVPDWVWPTTWALMGTGGAALAVGGVGGMLLPNLYATASREHGEAIQAIITTYPQSLSDQVGIQPNADGQLMDTAKEAPKKAPEPGQNDV